MKHRLINPRALWLACLVILTMLLGGLRNAQAVSYLDCSRTSTGLKSLIDMSATDYYPDSSHPDRQDGGLYGGGVNRLDDSHPHRQRAAQATSQILPRDANGNPDPTGRIGFVSLGMSNASIEYSAFVKAYGNSSQKNPRVILVDGAQPGATAVKWASSTNDVWTVFANRISAAGLSPLQVQVIWMKLTDMNPKGEFPTFAQKVRDEQARILWKLKTDYPNVQIVYFSSRIYAGYSLYMQSPEPYAYQGAFSNRWLILDQMAGGGTTNVTYENSPVLLWGPYLWADGLKPNAEGLIWECSDFIDDGVHPTASGAKKVADKLYSWFSSDPLARSWFSSLVFPTPSPVPTNEKGTPTPTLEKLTSTPTPTAATLTKMPTLSPTPTSLRPTPTVTTTITPSSTSVTGANLLLNPSFELDTNNDGYPDKWSLFSKFTRSSELAYLGSYSGKLYATDNSYFFVNQTVTGITAGKNYSLSGWVNIPATTDTFTFSLEIIWLSSTGTIIRTDRIGSQNIQTSGWIQISGVREAPAGAISALVRLRAGNLNAAVYVDNLVFSGLE